MSSPRGLSRQEFTTRTKGLALKRCMRDGVPHCEGCGIEINARTGPIFEHDAPAMLGGDNSLENCKVHCKSCASIKTASEDVPRMAKADRVFKAHHGIKSPRQKIATRGFAKAKPQRRASAPIEKWRGFAPRNGN